MRHKVLAKKLRFYDRQAANYLVQGFTFGFKLNNCKFTPNLEVKNLLSASKHPEIIETKLNKELIEGRLAGPFDHSPFQDFVVSPIGLQPKKVENEFRLIHHLSHPKGSSINDGISEEYSKVRYATVPEAVEYIKKSGQSCFLAKTDIKSAFKIIPIHPSDYKLTGMKFNKQYYYDKTLPQGCSSSCKIFETFSHALEWLILQQITDTYVLHILDDFLFIAHTYELCQIALTKFIELCSELGVPIANEKTMGPLNCLSFAGIELDSVEMCARLPKDKVNKMQDLTSQFLQRKSVKLKELQSLTGLLNFACTVIVPGRAFLRRLYDLTVGLDKDYYHIRLNKEVKEDLLTWKQFLDHYNGKSMFLNDVWLTSENVELYTDACTSLGFGAMLGRNWTQGLWPPNAPELHITILELYPIYLAVELWGDILRNKALLVFSDNMAVVHILNKSSSKDKTIMKLVRKLVLKCLHLNLYIKARHIPGKQNCLADYLSRFQNQKFKEQAPHMNTHPTEVPHNLLLTELLKI